MARSYAATFGLPVTVTRFANIYGPADLNYSRIIPGTILSVLNGERPVIRSDGTPQRDFLYVDDVIDAYLMLSEHIEDATGEAFNFGYGEPVQILRLVLKVIELAGSDLEPDILLETKIEKEIDAQYLSVRKVEERFGLKPRVSLDEGLKKTIDWYRANCERI